MNSVERFWSHVKKGAGCWEWQAAVFKERMGYGAFMFNGKTVRANRFAWFATHGAWPDGFVLHSCDNPKCVKPEHLFLGTAADNVADMRAKGRARNAKGEGHGKAKLTESLVREVRRRCRSGETHNSVALSLGVSKSTVSHAVQRRTWTEVSP